jgi:hypothetical protein
MKLSALFVILVVAFAHVAGVAAKHGDVVKERKRIEKDFDKGGMRIRFEKGLTEKQRDAILDVVLGITKDGEERVVPRRTCADGSEEPDTCSARTVCYLASCWVPLLGLACFGCMAINCCP